MVDCHVGTGIVLIVISAISIISSIINDYINFDDTKIVRITSVIMLIVGILFVINN